MEFTPTEARLIMKALRVLRCVMETGNPNLMATNVPETWTKEEREHYACYPKILALTADEMRIILSLVDIAERFAKIYKE